jgi:hypothetical protein
MVSMDAQRRAFPVTLRSQLQLDLHIHRWALEAEIRAKGLLVERDLTREILEAAVVGMAINLDCFSVRESSCGWPRGI